MSIVNSEEGDPVTEIELSDVRILHGVSPALHSGGAISHLHDITLKVVVTLAFSPSMESFSLLGTVK